MVRMIRQFADVDWDVYDETTEEYIEVRVEYSIYPGSPPDFYDPGSGPDITIEAVTYKGEPYTLSTRDENEVTEWIAENHDYG